MITKIKKTLSTFKYLLFLMLEFIKDGWRYFKSVSSVAGSRHKACHLESNIVRRYHILEKGLVMPDFRPRFGIPIVKELNQMLLNWGKSYSFHPQVATAWKVLEMYKNKHEELGVNIADIYGEEWKIPSEYLGKGIGGVKALDSLTDIEREVLGRVMKTRSSVRNYDSTRTLEEKVLQQAVRLAITTPSVCNRQTWRVHAYSGKKAQQILALQNGNRGFGQTIPTVLIITTDMRYFVDAIERYQPWIDGGMFSMSLLLSLHALGIGAIPLNWAVLNKRDKKLHDLVKLPYYERVIMFIGCGYPESNSSVTHSARREVSEILDWNN